MKIMKCFLICTVVCFLFITDCYANAWTGTNEIDYVDDGVQCLPKGKFDRYRVVSRKVKNIEVMGIKHSKWMRITDVYRANTGRDHQTVSALPIYKDKQNITITASATIPINEFISLGAELNYDLIPSKDVEVTAVPDSGDLLDGEYTAYYVRKSWQTVKMTVETVYEFTNKLDMPKKQFTETTEEYYDNPLDIGPDDRTFIFAFDKSLLKKKLPSDVCDGYKCEMGSGYDHPYAPD